MEKFVVQDKKNIYESLISNQSDEPVKISLPEMTITGWA